jgi:hypothetical protein
MRFVLVLLATLGTHVWVHGQNRLILEADTPRIRLGEQFDLHLRLFLAPGASTRSVQFPVFGDSLDNGGALVVKKNAIDTLRTTAGSEAPTLLQQKFTITSFDSGFHKVGPFTALVDGETLTSNPIQFELLTFEVDTTLAIKDVKDIAAVEYTLIDWLRDNRWVLLVLAGLCLTAFAAMRLFKKKKTYAIAIATPKLAGDVQALLALDELYSQKRWLAVSRKVYFSELTDVIRHYIEFRFEILAMEQTSAELLASLAYTDLAESQRAALRQLLEKADLVKFAKGQTEESECINALEMGRRFVESTRIQKTEPNAE